MSFITQQLKEGPEEQLWAAKQDKPLCPEIWGHLQCFQAAFSKWLGAEIWASPGQLQVGLGASRWEHRSLLDSRMCV